MTLLVRVHAWVKRRSESLRWLPPLLVRLTLFAVFSPTGWGKLHSLDKVTAFFTELGIPHPHFNAVLVASTELVCGALLLVGLATRLAAMPLIISMTVAIATAKRESIEGLFGLFGLEEFIYIILLTGLVLVGAGAISIDGLIGRRLERLRS